MTADDGTGGGCGGSAHLAAFLEGYARFARLPKPRLESLPWSRFLEGIRVLFPAVTLLDIPSQESFFDAGQLQQALINLLKNSFEASAEGASVELSVAVAHDGAATLSVADRGSGMSDEVLKNALLPFFTTKETGTGLGLALCREIVEAHRGKLRVGRREGGGTIVSIWLPGAHATPLNLTGRLTLTHA